MKTIFAFIVALAVLTVGAQAQRQYAAQSLGNMPDTLATTVETNLANPPLIDCRYQKEVGVTFSFNQSGASTSNVVYVLHKSVDGSVWDTNRAITVTVASAGATRVDYHTNFDVGGAGWLRLYAIRNTTALTTMTNLGVKYGLKILP